MTEFLSPSVTIRELPSLAGNTPVASSSVPIFHATAERAPVNRPLTVTSLADYQSVFGSDDGGYGFQSASGFFANDGRRLVVNRIAHYTDITNPLTLTAVAAETTLVTPNPATTEASKTSAAGPWNLHPSILGAGPYALDIAVDGAGASSWSYLPTQGFLLAGGVPGGIGSPGDEIVFELTFPGGATTQHTYTVPGAAPTTVEEWAASITAQVPGMFVVDVAGALELRTDGYGAGFNVSVISGTGTALVQSGLSVASGTIGGPVGISDASEVTDDELAPLLQAAWVGGGGTTVVANLDDTLTVETVATGASASLSAVTGTLSTVILFTPAGLVTGTGAGGAGVNTLKFIASSEGAHGNTLSVTTARQDRILTTLAADLTGGGPFPSALLKSVDGVRPGMQLYFEDSVTGAIGRGVVFKVTGLSVVFTTGMTVTGGDLVAANNPLVTKETLNVTVIVDGNPTTTLRDMSMSSLDTKFYIGNVIGTDPQAIDPRQRVVVQVIGAPVSSTEDPRPTDVVAQVLSGGLNGGAVVDNDYTGSQASGLGIYASDSSSEFSMMAIPGIETVPVHRGMMDYANLKKRHVAILNVPPGLTDVQAVDWVTVQAALFGTYTIAYAGELNIIRESTGAPEVFPAAGYLCGVYARTDVTRNVATPPSGVRNGLIAGAVGVSNGNYYSSKARRDTLYPNPGINTVYSLAGAGIVAWGQLTLDPTSDRGSIGVRRAMLSLERDLDRIANTVLFELNTPILREGFITTTTGYLRQRWKDGVLQGDNVRSAFTIVCNETNNPPSVVNARQFYADIAVNVIPGIDYAVINIKRDDRSLIEELASAA